MVFNRHLKALNLCNHSDTIACVLYELLVNLELINVGFQTHDQGSTSFSFVQFSKSCCAVASPWQLVYYISETLDCQGVFWKFFWRISSSKNIYRLLWSAFRGVSAARQLDHYSNVYDYCQGLFLIFSTNFERDFWARCMLGICCAMATSCGIG